MNKSFMKNRLVHAVMGAVVMSAFLGSTIALAQTTPTSGSAQGGWGHGHMMGRMPGVFGTVSALSGTTITVASKGFGKNATATTYSVDASNATVTKNGASSSVSNIAVGDTVMVQGTVSGTSVTATTIHDGMMMRGKGPGAGAPGQATNPLIQGNGQPVVGGTVATVGASTFTITNKGNVTYSVDASSATIKKGNATSSVADIVVGDNVIVQGTINGTSITASSVIDQGIIPTATNSTTGMPNGRRGFMGGFLGALGGLFQHLFGFI